MLITNNIFEQTLNFLQTQKIFVIDIETSGLDVLNTDKICGIGIGTVDGQNMYFPFRHSVGDNLSLQYLFMLLNVLQNKILIGHNIKFDIKGLFKEGFVYTDCYLIDTMVMVRLCSIDRYPDMKLSKLIAKYINPEAAIYDQEHMIYMKQNKIISHNDNDSMVEAKYCCLDIENTRQLYLYFNKIIKASKQTNIWQHECKVTKVLLNMEIEGVKIDLNYAIQGLNKLSEQIISLREDLFKIAKTEFNPNSPKQIGAVFESLGFTSTKKTVKNNASWDNSVIAAINHPLADKLHEYRSLAILRNTFFRPYAMQQNEIVSPSFKNWKTITGRLSCANPNLQNIPAKVRDNTVVDSKLAAFLETVKQTGGGTLNSSLNTGDEGFEDDNTIAARRLFIPREDFLLFSIDLTQAEVLVFLYYIQDIELLNTILQHGFDFHDFVAIEAFGANKNDFETFKYFRRIAKNITFGILFGMGITALAKLMGKTTEEALHFKSIYFERIPKAIDFITKMKFKVENNETIYSAYGRRFCVPPQKSYTIINYLVQGTAGEILKESMINIDNFFRDKRSHMLVQIHDELLIEIHKDELGCLKNVCNFLAMNKLGLQMQSKVSLCDGSWANKKVFDLNTLSVIAQ